MARRVLLTLQLVLFYVLALAALPVVAAPRAERLLPDSTKGFLSIPNTEELGQRWEATQLGQLMNDPVMKPFADDLKRQLKSKFSQTGVRLGITLDDVTELATQELAVAIIQPDNDPKAHALAMIVDVTGHTPKAQALLDKISQNQLQKGAKKSSSKVGEIEITSFVLPPKKGQPEAITAFFFLHDNLLVAADHAGTIQQLAKRVLGGNVAGKTLAELPAYQIVMKQCDEVAGEMAAQVRWYADPFGYAEAVRAMSGGRKKRGTDLLKVLANQGFKAVQALGGQVALATGEHELVHRTFVYAPADPEAKDGERYRLAARILAFPNAEVQAPLPFVPRELATHITLNWKLKESFEHIGSLVDEVAGEPGVFEEVLKSIEIDRNGPQVNLRNELLKYASERFTIMSDCHLPVTTKSERIAVAIAVTDEAAVAKAINKIMSSDPNAHKHEAGGRIIWEIINDQPTVEVEAIEIEGGQFVSTDDEEKGEPEKPMIPNSAVTVAHGHLLISTHVDYIRELLKNRESADSLGEAADFNLIQHKLLQLGAGKDALRGFTRTDEAYRATYELVKQGKMPESETFLGKLLNKAFAPDDEDELREQQIDGSKMPEFDAVRRFLGPAGTFVRSEENGWIVVGCLQSKETP